MIISTNVHKRLRSHAFDKIIRILIVLIIYGFKYFNVVSGIVIIIIQDSGLLYCVKTQTKNK